MFLLDVISSSSEFNQGINKLRILHGRAETQTFSLSVSQVKRFCSFRTGGIKVTKCYTETFCLC